MNCGAMPRSAIHRVAVALAPLHLRTSCSVIVTDACPSCAWVWWISPTKSALLGIAGVFGHWIGRRKGEWRALE